jgi:mannose-6-phosphate isomerase-like protein (cupin superfamily)
MRLAALAALEISAMALGCGRAPQPPNAPIGVVEKQADASGEAASARPSEPHRAPFETNVLRAARDNEAYRRVLFTGAKTQLVLMTIVPGGDIGFETHPNVEQLVFIASGQGKAVLDGVASQVAAGDVIVVTPGTHHDVVNTSSEPLRIYTVYAPPNHIDGRVHQTKADAEADKADEAFGRAVR